MSGGSRVSIPGGLRRTIQNIKEITGNHSDEEVHAMLKECGMDPNETTQKLLLQDTFHEVKRKRDKKKENSRELADSRRRSGVMGRGGRSIRGGYPSRFVSNDTGGGRINSVGMESGVIQGTNKGNASSSSLPTPNAENRISTSISSSMAAVANGPTKADQSISAQECTKVSGAADVPVSEESSVGEINGAGSSSISVDAKSVSAPSQPSVPSISISGVYASSSDPVLVPSVDARAPGVAGAIKRHVGSQRMVVETTANKLTSRVVVGSQPLSLSGKVSPQLSNTCVHGKMQSKPQLVEGNKLYDSSHSVPSSSATASAASRPSSNYSNRSQQSSGSHKVGTNKEWKPKSTHVSAAQPSATHGTSNVTPFPVHAVDRSQSASSSMTSDITTSKLEKKLEDLQLLEIRQVIIPHHLQVPESEKHGLSFGSFDASFKLGTCLASGTAVEDISTPSSELSQEIEEVSEVKKEPKEETKKEHNPALLQVIETTSKQSKPEMNVLATTLRQSKPEMNEDEEDPDEEVPCEEEPGEESCEDDPDEEAHEEMDEDEPNEGSEHESSEEDPSEASEDVEKHELKATATNSDKKKAAHKLVAEVTKQVEQNAGVSSIAIQEKPQNLDVNDKVPYKQNTTRTAGKKRQSRWDTHTEAAGEAVNGTGEMTKKRKTRWAADDPQLNLHNILKVPVTPADLEIQKLNAQLQEITQKLLAREVCDDRPESERSPSPPPIFNDLGIRINTREVRFRTKLINQRRKILSDLMQRNPALQKNPAPKPEAQFSRKLFIPSKEYPDYNFVGLILGPRGVTQKRMEKETGARILLRGKGSDKEGKQSENNSSDEDLHVLIEADTQNSLDEAVAMVEKLLVPIEEAKNEHKMAQLRELAELRGTLRAGYTPKTRLSCGVCGDVSHLTAACPLTASTPGTSINPRNQVSSSPGGGLFSSLSTPPVWNSTIPQTANPSVGSLPTFSGTKKEIDEANIYIGYLPQSLDDDKLIAMFLPFGQICEAKVMRDRVTGLSKGFGFIKYVSAACATEAIARMNGLMLEGHRLAVRVAGRLPVVAPPVTAAGVGVPPHYTHWPNYPVLAANSNTGVGVPQNFTHLPTYPGPAAPYNTGFAVPQMFTHQPSYPLPAAIAQSMSHQSGWAGPSGSVFPGPYASYPMSSSLWPHVDPLNGQSPASFGYSSQFQGSNSSASGTIISPDDLAQFPGYVKSFDSPDNKH